MPPYPGGIFIEARNIPIDFVTLRASDIPQSVMDSSSNVSVGITGSDIIWESGMGKNAGEEIPIYELDQNAKESALYIGVYPRFTDRVSTTQGLNGKTIATKYPRITREIALEKGISVEVKKFSGSIEGLGEIYSYLWGLMDIISSGETARSNGIKILEIFYKVSVRMIDAPGKMTYRELAVFGDLRELITVALQRKRMV